MISQQASKSRAAQEQLTELEKLSAPFEEQLEEAAKFIGVDADTISASSKNGVQIKEQGKDGVYYGREEWLLKWLLKRLQATGDAVPR